MKKVLCVLPVEQRHREKLEKAGDGCEFTYAVPQNVTAEQAQQAEIIIGNVDPQLINASDRLELLQLNSAGADPYIKSGILSSRTALTNSTGAYSKAVAEHAFALTLMLQKKLYLYRDVQSKAEWSDFGTVKSIADATVLVVGLGDIGCHYASMVKALGAYVIGVKRRASAKPDCVDELYTMEKLDELLPRADVVFSILPGTSATYHFYTPERFSLMKDSAYFINCGRGGAVASDVLYDALSNGIIAGAAVDVTEPEPLPPSSPLWKLSNIIITPHISGFYHLPETFERVVDIAADNLHRFVSGTPLKNVVDFGTGYKK